LTSACHLAKKTIMASLEKNMADLKYIVDSQVSAQWLMMMVHGQIHPNLQPTYNLKLKQ
jgi:hypothetical protein